MYYINKQTSEPSFLTKWKTINRQNIQTILNGNNPQKGAELWNLLKNDQTKYLNLDNKTTAWVLKLFLVKEQGGLCGYCNKKISAKETKIEHIKDKSTFPEYTFHYHNLIACCCGNQNNDKKEISERNKKNYLHCDAYKTIKDWSIFFISPTNKNSESVFLYDKEGNIQGNIEAAEETIEIFNLNNYYLKAERKDRISVWLYEESDYINYLEKCINYDRPTNMGQIQKNKAKKILEELCSKEMELKKAISFGLESNLLKEDLIGLNNFQSAIKSVLKSEFNI